jgi:molybdenum cofactor cytidylyltransferase
MNQPGIGGLIICAGLSERMGHLKPLISFNEKTFLAHIILKLNPVCQTILVITGNKSDRIKDETSAWFEKNHKDILGKVNWCYNPDYRQGMLTSLQKGISEMMDCKWVLYHFVDQPTLPESFYKQFFNQLDDSWDWIQPAFNNCSGHPLLLSASLFTKILKLKTSQTLRDISRDENVNRKIWKCSFPQILDDYDTPQHLKKLSKEFQ